MWRIRGCIPRVSESAPPILHVGVVVRDSVWYFLACAPASAPPSPPRSHPTQPTPKSKSASRGGGRGGTTNLSGGGGGGGSGSGSAGEEIPNAIAYNNAYVEDSWGAFRHARAMRLITRKASAAGVELPSSPLNPKCKVCPAYHIKGVCNTGCGNVGDHAVHTWEQYTP